MMDVMQMRPTQSTTDTPRRKPSWRRYCLHIFYALFVACGLWVMPQMRSKDAAKMQALAHNGARVTGVVTSNSHAEENGEIDYHRRLVDYRYFAHPRGDMQAPLTPYNQEVIADEIEIADLRVGAPIELVYNLRTPAEAQPTFVLRRKIPTGLWGPWLTPLPLLIVLLEGVYRWRKQRAN